MTIRPMAPPLWCLCLFLVLGAGVEPALAQAREKSPPVTTEVSPPGRSFSVQVYAYTLRYKPASEALMLIRPLLTARGTVELQPEGNTLVVRDTLAALGRIVPALRSYDRPPQPLRMRVMVVRADNHPAPQERGRSLPDWLEERLRALLRWDFYRVLADSGVQTREGESVTHEVGETYGVSFRMGTVLSGDRVKLHDFQVWRAGTADGRGGRDEPLVEATLNLSLDKPKVLGLANSESSDHALMVVLTCERMPEPRRGGGRP
jgi:hypothetical protein